MYTINYQNISIFSKLIKDYLSQSIDLENFYNYFPTLENFEKQIDFKSNNFKNREVLTQVLFAQNKDCAKITFDQIQLLNQDQTYTITTGHQLNLFTGPLYVFYKIITVLNTCKNLKNKYPNQHFVPIFWMASEDHDFDEINHFYYGDKKIIWEEKTAGPVGRISTEALKSQINELTKYFPLNENGKKLIKLFEDAYGKKQNLADATKFLIYHFFEKDGIVIIDGDDKHLKSLMIPIIKSEILNQNSFNKISQTNDLLTNYHVQINPREINWFYIKDDLRERIIFQNGKYFINNTSIHFSKDELTLEIENFPERFSPNALMRPLYQEFVLPNLAYIGGAAEVAYWLQLKSTFDFYNVTFPMVMLRDHVVLMTEKQIKKLEKYDINPEDLFLDDIELSKKLTKQYSYSDVDFRKLTENLESQFSYLKKIISQTDKSFEGAVLAEQTRQLKSIDKLEKRFWKAEKKRLHEKIENVLNLKNELFPRDIMQERVHNFSSYYVDKGEGFVDYLKNEINFDSNHLKILKI